MRFLKAYKHDVCADCARRALVRIYFGDKLDYFVLQHFGETLGGDTYTPLCKDCFIRLRQGSLHINSGELVYGV